MTDHNPAASEALRFSDRLTDWPSDVLAALTAANLAVVGEGEALIKGKVVRLDLASCASCDGEDGYPRTDEPSVVMDCSNLLVIQGDGSG